MTDSRTGSTTHSKTRVAIVDDHELFAQSLALALGLAGCHAEPLPVKASSPTPQLLASIVRWRPDVVLLDLDLGEAGEGTALIAPLTRAGIVVIVLTASTDRVGHGEALAAGAAAVLSKSGTLAEIRAAVRQVVGRRALTDVKERELLIRRWRMHRSGILDARRRFDALTERERQVLAGLTLGRTVGSIARRDVVSETTVRSQVKSILAKLEVSSQLAAVALAHQVGWQPPAATPAMHSGPAGLAQERAHSRHGPQL